MKNILFTFVVILLFVTSCNKFDKSKTQNDYKGLTFTVLAPVGLGSALSLRENIVNYNEIIGYDSLKRTFLLTDKAKNRILKYQNSSFVIAVNGKVIFNAAFIPMYVSSSRTDIICLDPFSVGNKYRLNLGYPEDKINFKGVDQRNDKRILDFLKKENKLISL